MNIKNRHIAILSIILAFSILCSYILKFNNKTDFNEIIDIKNIESILNKKQNELISISQKIENIIENDTNKLDIFFYNECLDLFKNKGIGFFLYKDNALKYWTSNDIPVPISSTFHFFDSPFINLNNGWYICHSIQKGNFHIVGLFQIKKEYSYENDNLSSYFWHEFNLPHEIVISTDYEKDSYKICIEDEDTCLYLLVDNTTNSMHSKFTLKHFLLIFNFMLLILILVLVFVKLVIKYNKYNIALFLGLLLSFVTLRFLMLYYNYLSIFINMQLFSPELFAESFWLPSLGDYFINVILFITYSILFYLYFDINLNIKNTTKVKITSSLFIAVLMTITTSFISNLFYGLVWNSSIVFDFGKVLSLNIYSIKGILIIVTVISSFILLFYKLMKTLKEYISPTILLVGFSIGAFIGAFFSNEIKLNFNSILIFNILYLCLWSFLTYVSLKQKIKYYTYIIFLVIISMITSVFFSRLSNKKELDAYKVITYNLAAERDISAEFFIKQIYFEIQNDENISDNISKKKFIEIENRINNLFLSKRYFNKYETQITVCSCSDSLLIEPDMISVGCLDYFRSQILQHGIIIPNTNFYFLDNHNGRISYLGEISTLLTDSTYVNVYIELNSKIFSEGLGYPELLLDKKLYVKKDAKDYNYAKYNKNRLISSKGDYKYQFTLSSGDKDTSEYAFYTKDGYIHFRYNQDKANVIILSKPDTQFSNELVSFTYIFAILFTLFNLFWFTLNLLKNKTKSNASLKIKTQISYVTILILSLILTGGISIYFIVKTYKQKQKDALQDKVYSVVVVLEDIIGDEKELDYSFTKNLNAILTQYSNVFYTDINIYDLNGLLFASSRIELYDKGLKGRYMNNIAYEKLILSNSGALILNENIDKVNYLSAYLPLKNYNNEIIAYLNLPYFARQSEFTAEISNFIIAFSNIFLILILISVIVGIFISRQLTLPLVLIRDKIKAIDLVEKNEKIAYNKDDEIGRLIKEYNRKVDELNDSANKLAQSERETAWREMAKQIAHEIKNPLTPIKLSVQYLEKAYDMKAENWEDTFKKVSKTIIEQIDTLSRIASEFSNFAQMPDSHKEVINLKDIILNSVQLFNIVDNIEFDVKFNCNHPINIFADKEQMIRVFNNLIKNGIQAIPKNKNGILKIIVEEKNGNYIIKIIDNGTGISKDMIPKIFQPNFTTKSGGMGLGLSMVKNMLMNNDATIYFNTEENVGTEFIIEIPMSKIIE